MAASEKQEAQPVRSDGTGRPAHADAGVGDPSS